MAMTLLTGGKAGANVKQASAFITTLLHGVTKLHMLHLMTKGPQWYPTHIALGELYAGLDGLADGLAESFMGCSGQDLAFGSGAFDFNPDPLTVVRELYAYVEGNRQVMGPESHIQNEIDTICTLLATGIYKLTRA